MFVKICGITSEDDALLAVAMGADALGFIFAPSSRQVAAGHVRDIVRRLPAEILTVGVFRNEAPQRVVEVVHAAGLAAVQLHGHESVEDATWIKSRVGVLIQAFPAGGDALRRAGDWGADVILVDSPNPGSGQVFDWSLATDAPKGHRVMLAGGLTPGNVAAAIAQVRPWGVDVASGVEAAPGRKDPRKVRAFVSNAKAASVPADGSGWVGDDVSSGDQVPSDDDVPVADSGSRLYDWQEDI